MSIRTSSCRLTDNLTAWTGNLSVALLSYNDEEWTAVGDSQWLCGGFERADVPVIEEAGEIPGHMKVTLED